MKKVIGVAVAASLVAGMAFADVAVGLNARLQTNMYDSKSIDKKDTTNTKSYKETTTFDLDGVGGLKDTLSFNAKTDFAGVQLELVPNGNDQSVAVDTKYNGWLAFGALKFSFGTFDSRFVDRYNVTAAENGLLDSDMAKYGTFLLNDANKFMKDANNISAVAGTRKPVLIADYTFKDLPGTLLVKAGLVDSGVIYDSTDNWAEGKDKETQSAGYLFEADYSQKDLVKAQVSFKKVVKDQMILGVYVQPLMLPINTAFGFTYGTNDKVGTAPLTADFTAMAFDARASYNVTDAMKVSAVVKYETMSYDGAASEFDADSALSFGAEVSYIINDLVTVALDGAYYNQDLDGNDDAKNLITSEDSKQFSIRPVAVFTAGKNARITAGLQYDSYTDSTKTGKTTSELRVPVTFRVKM